MYIPLTTRSAFSLQEGLLTPVDPVQAAQTDGMPAMGLTDQNLLSGVIEFATACKAAGIRAIFGLEINLNGGPVNPLATGPEGWSCLCQQFGKANSIARSGGNSALFFY